MKNSGLILVIVGLLIFFVLGLPVWLVKLIGVALALFGLFAIIAPAKASVWLDKMSGCCKKKEKEVVVEEPKEEKKASKEKK